VPSTGGTIIYAPTPVNANNSIKSAFVEYNTAISNDVSMNASLRLDDHSQAGTYPTARLAATWEIDPTSRLLVSTATGFRAPSIYELNSLYNGSRNLKAEKSESFELSIEKDITPSTMFSVTGFQTKVNNKIEWATNNNFNDLFWGLPTLGYEAATDIFHGGYKNTTEVTTVEGGELSFKSAISEQFILDGHYSYTEAKTAAGTRILRVPKHTIKIAATYKPNERANLKVFATRTIDRLDYNAQNQIVNAKNYTLVNFNSSYAINQTLTAFANIENLLNEKYETVTNFNQPGRSIFAGIRASF
jgi:vitamin B12 transporter